jgi:Ca2+-dependent lipid-binding protein
MLDKFLLIMSNKTATHAKGGHIHHETVHSPYAGQEITEVTSELEDMAGCDEEDWDKHTHTPVLGHDVSDCVQLTPSLWHQFEPPKEAPKPKSYQDRNKNK